MGKFTIVISLTLLAACVSNRFPVTSPYYEILAGSEIILKQPLTIRPNIGRVYIQYGKLVSNMKPDRYYPHCWFTAWTISVTEVIINPDRFTVIGSKKYERYVNKHNRLMFAGMVNLFNSRMSASITAIESITELKIQSAKQPDIRRFTCNLWSDPSDAQHLTVAEINQTLGDIAELKPLNR